MSPDDDFPPRAPGARLTDLMITLSQARGLCVQHKSRVDIEPSRQIHDILENALTICEGIAARIFVELEKEVAP